MGYTLEDDRHTSADNRAKLVMCGIVGLVTSGPVLPSDTERVSNAVAALTHRGPDGRGLNSFDHAVLGHRRLSIIDTEHGGQPMTNEDHSVWTVFNGEIWNHEQLRVRLTAAGHSFGTRCDTEVLVHGYEQWGDDLLEHLDGMFAFAIWDDRARRLLLARDRLGKKPLYWAKVPTGLAFGSDARSVLLAGGLAPRLARGHLAEFIVNRYVTSPRTLFEEIHKLRPGCALSHTADGISNRHFWSVPTEPRSRLAPADLRRLLRSAVRRRLMSDVPVGAFLSGGLDSTAVVALMTECAIDAVPTFTIGFSDPVFDERTLAAVVARKFHTEHHELVVSRDDYLKSLPRLAWYRDEPIVEPAEIPVLLLSEFAGRQLKVILSGEGGDELFGGYPKYRAEHLLSLPGRLPELALRAAVGTLSQRQSDRQLGRAVGTLSITDELTRWISWFRSFSPQEAQQLLAPELAHTASPEYLTAPLSALLSAFPSLDRGRRHMLSDLLTYLPDNMLMRGDKVVMAASMEARTPLLDRSVVEAVSCAPASQRSNVLRPKRLLREAVSDLLPPEVIHARKRGFPVPVARFFAEDYSDLAQKLLLSERALDRGLFKPEAVESLVSATRQPGSGAEVKVFTLLSLELWLRSNVDQVTLQPSSADPIDDG